MIAKLSYLLNIISYHVINRIRPSCPIRNPFRSYLSSQQFIVFYALMHDTFHYNSKRLRCQFHQQQYPSSIHTP
ncbi:hypothetical protein EYC80_003429 [Monilinia laxa]|uniref:Uncharacterized protein n=1 Tax=Monilinia laxa TaxID=61186 RepID=A0A5N6KDU1_MONLA|nr:hypothetical protein EYC80_003429 [Monilinia laxa]